MFRILTLFLTAFLQSQMVLADTNICGQIFLKDIKLKLNANETIMVCGTGKPEHSWQEVPIAEAQEQLTIILSNHGYHEPRFERQKDTLNVWAGPIKKISSLNIVGADGILKASKKRKIVGAP